jgi:hypothetical protein
LVLHNIKPINEDLTTGWAKNARNASQSRGLTCPVWPQQSDDLAWLNVEGQIVDGEVPLVLFAQSAHV